MNRVCALPLVLLLGALAAAAQTSAANESTGPIVLELEPAQVNSCPVGILVKQSGIARLLFIRTGAPDGPAVGLRITLTDSRSLAIVGARITVRGYTEARATAAVGQSMTGVAANVDPGGVEKSFNLTLKVSPGKEASTDLWVEGLVSVTAVDLDSLTYANGSRWRSRDDGRCRIDPNIQTLTPTH